ncbi:phage integrase N-terminal SAM-like domain-containing protein [Novosphingobium profundi]|uniref:phage integrase N-terminal SAM-like domain-containing protein n=1 Tax=Novosphingobium profundi TaxID=1774954 RepID=UPI0039AEE593
MAEDMDLRHLSRATQRNYLRDVERFATWLGRPPDTASGEDLRQFQLGRKLITPRTRGVCRRA